MEHLELSLPLSKRSFSLLNLNTYRDTYWQKAKRYFSALSMLPRNNADVTHCEKTVSYFQNKAVYRSEDRPADSLKMAFT